MSDLMKNETMSSLQITELTGKMHKDVLRAIREMESSWLKIAGRNFTLSEYKDSTGRLLPMYQLSKTECLYIATKFNDEARAKLVIRWEELETSAKPGFGLPQTFSEALQLAADQAKQLELQAPKVDYHDQVLTSSSAYNTNLIAKELGMSAVTLNKILQKKKVQYKQNGVWVLYHDLQGRGYTKTTTYSYTDSEGKTKTRMSTVWTESGRKFIHGIIKD